MPRMASKIIMSCMVPIFTRITLKVKLYRLVNHEQINVSNHVSHGKHRMISLNMTIMMLLLKEPPDDVTDNAFQDDVNYGQNLIYICHNSTRS